jgi:Cu-processing system permease protein
MVFTAIYLYNAAEFIILLLSHPIGRSTVFGSFFLCLILAFVLGFVSGICLPLFIYYPSAESLFLAIGGLFLIIIFTSFGFFISVSNKDKARGLGVVLLLWALFAFIYDGILIYFMYQFSDYPIEKPVLFLTFINPIDIARILVIMKTDASAMLGLSGAVFQKFFGSDLGMVISVSILIVWSILPLTFAWRRFSRKDF